MGRPAQVQVQCGLGKGGTVPRGINFFNGIFLAVNDGCLGMTLSGICSESFEARLLNAGWCASKHRKPIQRIPQITGQNMRISAGRLNIGMPEQLGHQTDVLCLAQHPRCKCMSQVVKPEVVDPGIEQRLAPNGTEHAAARDDLDPLGRVAIDASEHVATAPHHV